jgi:K+-sensing histidine kinase KdpD
MEVGYHIRNNDGTVIANSLKIQFLSKVNVPDNRIELSKCPINGMPIRHGMFKYPIGSIYLVSYDETITNKIFKRYFEACLFFIPNLAESEKEFKKKESQNFRRLRHNLVTHNTNILQELENTFYTHGILKGAQKQINYVKETFLKLPDEVALTVLKIIKSANLMKTDFDVYDMVSSNNPYIELDRHQIHKVLMSVLRPFWLDLMEKEINININECNEYVNIDYKSISVVFTHLFDNLAKYILPKSEFNITFNVNQSSVTVIMNMTSLKITDKDKERIFEENFSGEFAEKFGKSGDGIGMFMVKKLVELNKGKVDLKVNLDPKSQLIIMGIPFERNAISIEFKK